MKLGQILSTRGDLLPPEFIGELRLLQDRVEPAPWEEIERVVTGELSGPVEEVFASFERKPLAAASPPSPRRRRTRPYGPQCPIRGWAAAASS
ncbi:AarF/UbiB family protein [Microbispora bryophytorum]|uniref:ABC1 atypical kinase-like domain-containing protein n=1 Tax=Microbispora bryophytorum TaxID=1460882 RepID=A0A8H9H000_9ACTN|nr:AarF/UbiB family protein [Microbispora bryophytorum]TQS07188.1 AarF/ABC1/UbiB kinase family protein [Microbispora bryophytorum]GGO13546.1 hypothetical protein GCM10011574_33010 [Microbispora bryophytorum]